MASTFVKDIMKKNVITADANMTIKAAAITMKDARVGSVVVTKKNVPVGIITERDFVTRIAAEGRSISSPLSEVMSYPLTVVDTDETVWEAAEIMKRHRIHKLPVRKGVEIVGMVTATDLVEICSIGSDSNLRRICDQILVRMQNQK